LEPGNCTTPNFIGRLLPADYFSTPEIRPRF
jgi:hypothetical protein